MGDAGVDGLFGLSFFWHCSALTSAGLAHLRQPRNLGHVGCGGALCDDEAMRHLAAIPGLRKLVAQGTVASDDGFAALARSSTLEYLWGRECPRLTGRGFSTLAQLPSLRGLAVSCARVGDAALSLLPRFPELRELLPMDVDDAGFRHVRRCAKLESLWCMYCRDTTDAATAELAGLARLAFYYAGKTRITDRSLEILGRISSLQRLEFWETGGITGRGLVHLAALPRLRQIAFHGVPGVDLESTAVFPRGVRVDHSVAG